MKCKSWSNKINNFVVRRLKSIKINGQQQQQQQQQAGTGTQQQQQQQQQQFLSTCSTMPAMPKEKATAVSLSESNFSELKLKELTTSATVVAATAAAAATMATTATSRIAAAPPTASSTQQSSYQLQQQNNSPHHHSHQHQHHHHHQKHHHPHPLHHQQQRTASSPNICGCGAASAVDVAPMMVGSVNRGSSLTATSRYPMSNGHSSPLAAAVAQSSDSSLSLASSSASPLRNACNNNNNNNNDNTGCCLERLRNAASAASSSSIDEEQPSKTNSALDEGSCASVPSFMIGNNAINAANVATTATATATASTATSSASGNAATSTPPKKSAKDFIFGKYIGDGSFSSVYLAVDVNTKRQYAIKVCEKRQILRERKQEYVRREREVMHMMSNVPGFVNLSCTFQDNRSLYFVMTYAKNGDLLPYINKVGSFDADCTRHYAAELVLACEQMHSRNVVHRDLKPENILLDEDMHTLIADFGSAKILTSEDIAQAAETASAAAAAAAARASEPISTTATTGTTAMTTTTATATATSTRTRTTSSGRKTLSQSSGSGSGSGDDASENAADNDSGSDDIDSPARSQPRYHRQRRGSFVGTAQYVSPEVLQNGPITPAADLWALGCIIYQMISGLPPFRGGSDYIIFREILGCKLDFPEGFDKDAEDLVRKLLKIKPFERLGSSEFGDRYESIRSHPFFAGIDFDTVRQRTPPPINPYLPGVTEDKELRSHYYVPDDLEPGLDDRQISRLMGIEWGTAYNLKNVEIEKKTATKSIFDLTDAERQKRLEQQKSDKWHAFADNEVILKKGYINKRKGLFARRRMLLLTTGPRLIYIDPVQMIKKGEIPWSPELWVEPKNFKIFFVHTPNRTYYLEDPEGGSPKWVDAINEMRKLIFADPTTPTANSSSSTGTGTGTTMAKASSTSNAMALSASLETQSEKAYRNNSSTASCSFPLPALKTASN